jgi:PAS domain S-box-containing protein
MSPPEKIVPSSARPPYSLASGDSDRFELLVKSVRDYAIFILDPTGIVLTWNTGAEYIKGWRAEEIIGRSFETFYTADAIAAGWPRTELRLAARDGRFEDQGWRVRKDGSQLWASVVITALRGDDGVLQGFAKVTRDLTETRRQEEALRQSEEAFRLLVESVKDYALFMLDPDGVVRTWNAGAAAIHGYSAQEAVGRHFSIFFTDVDRAAGRPGDELQKALEDGRAQAEAWRLRKDGSLFWADVKLTSVRDPNGRLLGFAKITRDLTEQRRVADIEGASRRMTSFLAMLAHELRNPLAPIRNAASIMRMQPDLSPVLQRSRDIIERQIRHLTRLVDDLLDVGRVATGKIFLRREPLDYRDVLQSSVDTFAQAIAAKCLTLDFVAPELPLPMLGDATRLAQALQNVLGNAVRYTPAGGHIRLDVRIERSSAVTRVIDDGPGLGPDALERIFELFAQEDTARLPNDNGLGIGLSLARSLVSQHGGLITAESPGLGLGSTFVIRLPLNVSGVPEYGSPLRPPEGAPVLPRRILIVDDNKDAADSMADMLRLDGHEVLVAYDGPAALARADEFRPEWALLDINLPGMDGYTLLRSLRNKPALRGLNAIAVTGYGQQSDRDLALAAGFDAHLTKPVELAQIDAVIAAT